MTLVVARAADTVHVSQMQPSLLLITSLVVLQVQFHRPELMVEQN